MTGSLKGALQGAMWGAVGGLTAFGIGEALGHAGGILTKGVSAGKAFIKAAAHGLSRGIISMAQGGTFKSGFASGFTSSFFSPGTTGKGGFLGRTSISAIVGGTASALGGGKFANGAVSGAFVHMFNAENISSKFKSLVTKATHFFSRVEELAQINKEQYYEGLGRIANKAGSVGSAIVGLENANKNYLSQRSSLSKPIYTGVRKGVTNAIFGGGSGFAGTSLLRTVPSAMAVGAFRLGQEFGLYADAYVRASYE